MDEKILAVQRMQDYIMEHLQEDISLSDLARAAHFSPWYSARIFKELTQLAPAEYIRRLKLSKSAIRLRDEKVKVIDIAFDSGFNSVDGYQRAFYKEFGCNPKTFYQRPVPLSLFIPYGVKFKTLWKKEISTMEKVKNVFLQVIEKPKRKVIIKRGVKAKGYLQYCEEVGCDVWGILTSIKSISNEAMGLWLPKKYQKDNTSYYVQGVEVDIDYKGELPEGFECIELPAAKFLMFQSEPFDEKDYCEAVDSLQNTMDKYEPSMIGFEWDDDNPRIQLEPIGSRGYIELRAIK